MKIISARELGKGLEGVVYLIVCIACEREKVRAEYWGETSRTGFERGEEHVAGLENKYEKNSLWKHSVIYHGGGLERKDYRMEVIESHRSPLNRQVHEGVELYTNGADIILNSKSEWNHSKLPRVIIETGDEIEEDEADGMIRSTEMGGREKKRLNLRVKASEKRERENRQQWREREKRPRTE